MLCCGGGSGGGGGGGGSRGFYRACAPKFLERSLVLLLYASRSLQNMQSVGIFQYKIFRQQGYFSTKYIYV